MVRDPRDRRDLACLGLMVLVYGLVVAPVVHVVVDHAGGSKELAGSPGRPGSEARAHGHSHPHEGAGASEPGHAYGAAAGHDHEHGPAEDSGGRGHRHGWGSVEHLEAVAVSRVVVLAPVVRWVRLAAAVFRGPLWRPGEAVRLTAMPQGP